MAKLYFRYSVMNSGKSLNLIAAVHSMRSKGIVVEVMKPTLDTRSTDIRSRALSTTIESTPIHPSSNIFQMISDMETKPSWIYVDEAQFLSAAQVDQLARIADDLDISVICYGLRTDFRTHLFEGSKRLFEIADTFEELKTSCSCGRKAAVNARIGSDGQIITEGAQIDCGAEDKYTTMCRKCFMEKIGKWDK